MEAYLLDTSALAPTVDVGHQKHQAAIITIKSIGTAPIFVSALALAEITYGFQLHQKATGIALPDAAKMLLAAEQYPRLEVTRHTAAAYADLKAALAVHYMPNVTRQFRKRYVEDWIDKFTGKALGVDDNDLWICAQARETNFVLVTGDKGIEVIQKADPLLKLMFVGDTV